MREQILSFLQDDFNWKEHIHYFDSIASTNDVLKQMAQQGAPEGTVLIADRQTGGRGRLGRSFLSPSGVGIYMSVLLRPSCGAEQLMHLTCACAVAACNAIENAAGFRPGIKWTNDIVYQRRKLAGILTELSFGKSQSIDYAVVGIGINCMQTVSDFPEEIRGFAGSLSMFCENGLSRAKVAAEMVKAFHRMNSTLSDRQDVLSQYREDCVTLGQDVSVVRADDVRHGKALDIDDDGGLVVRFEDGHTETVNSGEVSVRGLYHYI